MKTHLEDQIYKVGFAASKRGQPHVLVISPTVPTCNAPDMEHAMRWGLNCGAAAGGGGGFGMTPWCDDLVCSWRRLLADRHSLPFPWTLSLHRQWCPSASHHPLTFLFLPALTFPLPFPFPSLGLSLRRPWCPWWVGGGGLSRDKRISNNYDGTSSSDPPHRMGT